MCPTFMCVDIISKTHHRFMVACRILHSYFHGYIFHFSICINRIVEDYFLIFIDVLDITSNPTFVMVVFTLFHTISFISNRDRQASVEKGKFLDPFIEFFKIKFNSLGEDFWVWRKMNRCTCTICITDHFQISHDLATSVFLEVNLTIFIYFNI